MKDNKYLKIAIVAIVIIGLVTATFFVGGSNSESEGSNNTFDPEVILANAKAESEAVKEEEKKAYTKISVAQYLDYYAGSEAKLILVGHDGCPYCQIANPILQNLAYKYDIEINYLDTDEFTDETQTAFVQSDEFFSSGFGTPLLFIVQNNTIVDVVDGLVDTALYTDFLTAYGYIK